MNDDTIITYISDNILCRADTIVNKINISACRAYILMMKELSKINKYHICKILTFVKITVKQGKETGNVGSQLDGIFRKSCPERVSEVLKNEREQTLNSIGVEEMREENLRV